MGRLAPPTGLICPNEDGDLFWLCGPGTETARLFYAVAAELTVRPVEVVERQLRKLAPRQARAIPPGGAPVNPLQLPERVRVLSLWHRWAAAVAVGVKTLETRRWRWPYEPGWLAIHAGVRADGKLPASDGIAPECIVRVPQKFASVPREVILKALG